MNQMTPHPESYFRGFIPRRDPLLLELERQARAETIPIIGPVVGELLFILARATNAVNILELGAAIGYSTIFLALGSEAAGGRVVTLEWDEAMATRARGNFGKAGLDRQIEIRTGDALKLMGEMAGPYDLIFMDIDKESYLPALHHCRRLLKIGGLLVTDNVGFAGAADFNREIFASPDWRTVHLLGFLPEHSPEHDGLSLAVRVK
jgi:predicted O-methyltransferase YrrM